MSANRKYYFLKLKDNFFDREDIKLLESLDNGMLYTVLYLKLCIMSLKGEGRLYFKDDILYDEKIISAVTRIDIDHVRVGIQVLKKLGLVTQIDSGELYISDIHDMIGRSSTEAERKKLYRDRINDNHKMKEYENKKVHKSGTLSQKCPTNVPLMSHTCPDSFRTQKGHHDEENLDADQSSVVENRHGQNVIENNLTIDETKNKVYKSGTLSHKCPTNVPRMSHECPTNVHQRLEIRDKRIERALSAEFSSHEENSHSKRESTKTKDSRAHDRDSTNESEKAKKEKKWGAREKEAFEKIKAYYTATNPDYYFDAREAGSVRNLVLRARALKISVAKLLDMHYMLSNTDHKFWGTVPLTASGILPHLQTFLKLLDKKYPGRYREMKEEGAKEWA